MVRLVSMFLAMITILATEAFAATLRVDPTQPPKGFAGAPKSSVVRQIDSKQLKLQQILITNDQSVAIINDQVVRAGDQLQGFRVKAISAAGVQLQYSGKRLYLRMFPEQIKNKR